MTRLSLTLIGLLVFQCWFAVPASAYTPSDPNFLQPEIDQHWKTLQTAHFRIHHQAEHKEYAQQLGAVAERVHGKLTAWLDWIPEDKTEVVILDSVDLSNGGATVLPYNQFYIYMPTPTEGEIMDRNPWMEMVFTHEYTHILQLDMASGVPKILRNIFGRFNNLFTPFTFPQVFEPSWVTEGIAVYSESNIDSPYGRLNNAGYDAMMRMEVQRGLRSLSEVSYEGYSRSRWPYGLNYLYGAYFYRFIETHYGHDRMLEYIREYGSHIIPWRMEKRAHHVFGQPPEIVWLEFQKYLTQRFIARRLEIEQRASIPTQTLYDARYTNRYLTVSSKGEVYFYHDDGSSHPQVRKLHLDGSSELLFEAEHLLHLDWNDHAGLLMSRLSVCDNTRLYADLYYWQSGMSSPQRLTQCGRYPHAAWRPDGLAIAAVQLEQSNSRLMLMDANGQNVQQLAALPAGDSIGHLAWSPDQTMIAATIKHQRSGWNIELFDLATRQWQVLTQTDDLVTHPHISNDGRSVYFLSDHGKAWNLRRIALGSDHIETLSNTHSMVEDAVALPDGSFRLIEYAANGEAISALTPLVPVSANYPAFNKEPAKINAIVNTADYAPVPYENVTVYSAFESMRPRSWFPLLYASPDNTSYLGVLLNGNDVLGFHHWNAAPLYYSDQQAWAGYASYNYYQLLTFTGQRQFTFSGDINTPTRFRDDETRYQILLGHSFNHSDSSFYIGGGVVRSNLESTVFTGSGTNTLSRDTLTGVLLRYEDAELYQRSISWMDGRHVHLNYESYDKIGRSDHSGKSVRIDWNEYLDLGSNYALYGRLLRANGDGGIRPYTLGGAGDSLDVITGSSEIGRRSFSLRGYPAGMTSLTGTNIGLVTAEWRIPLGLIYDGWLAPPLGLGRHSLALFVDRGSAWNNASSQQFKTGAGVEWKGEILIGYDLLHLGVILGVAHGFDPGGENQAYVRLGLLF
jgi:hypothetical protein